MVHGEYTIYPTINSTFQYPLDKLFEDKGFVYDVLESQSPFTIQQAIVQGSTQALPNIGDIIYTSQSQDNFFAALSYQSDFFMASVFQVGHSGELILQLTYIVNASLFTCYNLVLYSNDSVIINCIQHQTNLVTLFSFGQVNNQNITNITIKPEQFQQSAISIQRNYITFSYQFENYVDIYSTYLNYQFILQIDRHKILDGQFLKIYQNQEGIVISLQINSITIYLSNIIVINAQNNVTFIDFQVQIFSLDWKFFIIYLLSDHQIESLHVYQNGTYQYHSQAAFKQEYTKIFISRDSILLYGEKQLAYYKIDEDGSIKYYNYLNKNTKCQDLTYIQAEQVLYCISNNKYTPYQQGFPCLYSKKGVEEKGTIKLITKDIDGNTDFVVVKYIPLQPNDQGIYYLYENQDNQFKIEGRRKYFPLDLSQIIVGGNLTYNYNQNDQQSNQSFILDTKEYQVKQSTLCSIMYSQYSFSWVQACFQDGELIVEIFSSQFFDVNEIIFIQKIYLLADITQVMIIPFNHQGKIKIILQSTNKIYIYSFVEFVSLSLQSTIYMTLQNKDIQIQNIQNYQGILIIILTQNPNRVFYASIQNAISIPTQIQLDYSREVLQIATNTESYNFLIIVQAGYAQIVRFKDGKFVYSYEIIQKIKYPDGYLQSIVGPVQQGIFFYFYTETQSQLYFLQREFIKQIDISNNMFFIKVDNSKYNLVQKKLTYSFSNKFFYVLCQDYKGNQLLNIYEGSQEPIKLLRKSLMSQIELLASTVYQDQSEQYGADLIILSRGTSFNIRLLVTHKPYLIYLPEFSWQSNYQMKVNFKVFNNFTQTQIQLTLFVNQSYLQLTSQPKNSLEQKYKINNNTFKFNVSKMFDGPITNYSLQCDGCEIQQFQLPINDQFDTYQQKYNSYIVKEDMLYLIQKEGSLFCLNLNTKSGIELILQGNSQNCSYLFLEINTNNPSWVCQTGIKIIIYNYNPSNKKIQSSSIELLGTIYVINCIHTFGYLQIFSIINEDYETSFYSIIQYNITKEKQYVNLLINQKPIETIMIVTKPIILDDKILNPIIGAVGINRKKMQFFIITNIAINKTLIQFYPQPLSSYNTQNAVIYQTFQIGQPEKRDNFIFIKLYQSGFLATQLFEIKFNLDGLHQETQSICYFNQLNYTYDNQNNFAATSNGKQLIIFQNNIDSSLIIQKSDLLIYDLDICGNNKLVNPYQQQQLQLNIANFSTINYLNNETLIYITLGELSILKSTGQLTGIYKETEEESTMSVIASNPFNQATQSLVINQNGNKSTSQGLAWYLIVSIVMLSLVTVFYGYVFIRKKISSANVTRNQDNHYFAMR